MLTQYITQRDEALLFEWDYLNTKVIQNERPITSLLPPLHREKSEVFLQMSVFVSLCALQVFICVFLSARLSQETLSEPTLSHVESLGSRDAPLRC